MGLTSGLYRVWQGWGSGLINCVALSSLCRAGIDDVETDVVEIEAKLDKVWIIMSIMFCRVGKHQITIIYNKHTAPFVENITLKPV